MQYLETPLHMRDAIRRFVNKLPAPQQQAIRRFYYARKLGRKKFAYDEPEFERLDGWLADGDWVLDIGANVGQYTCRFAHLVGRNGHVIAFEPVVETFDVLASNVARLRTRNVTLLNVAACDRAELMGMTIPPTAAGVPNYYWARLTTDSPDFRVLSLPVDALGIQTAVRLVKIDVEGQELPVLRGMRTLLDRCHPILIVEDNAPELVGFLAGIGYTPVRHDGSPNLVCFWEQGPEKMQRDQASE